MKWDVVNNNWISDAASDIDSDPETYAPAPVVEYIEDLIFVPIGPDGQAYDPPPSSTNNPAIVPSVTPIPPGIKVIAPKIVDVVKMDNTIK